MMNESSHEYNTFKLPEQKTLSAVLRSIPQINRTDAIENNLMEVEFEVMR